MPYSSADPAANIGIGIQSGLGTPQTTATKFRFLKYLSGTSVEQQQDTITLREGGDGLDWGAVYEKSQKAAGQLVWNARPEALGQVLALIPGGATWNAASLPAIHTFHTNHASIPYGTLQVAYPGTSIVNSLVNTKFTGLTLEALAGEPWKFTAPFITPNPGASSAYLVPTYYGDPFWVFYQSPTYLIDGSVATGITGFKLDLSFGIEELLSQSITLDDISIMNRDARLEITRRYENPNLWSKIYMGASGGIAPTTTVATGSFEAAVAYNTGASLTKLRMVVPLVAYDEDKLTELDPDGKTMYETISAIPLKGATTAVYFELTNAHASVYGP